MSETRQLPEETTRAIATYAEPGSLIRTVQDWDARGSSVRTSLKLDTDDGCVGYIAALSGSDAALQDSVGSELIVQDWLLHVRELVDDSTGEVRPALRLVWLTRDGRRISGASKPVIDAWAAVVQMFSGRPSWPLLGITLERVKSANNPGSYLRIKSLRVIAVKTKGKDK